MSPLESQCSEIGWSLSIAEASFLGRGKWLDEDVEGEPEQIIADRLSAQGAECSWCEGASVLLLVKAAALDTLAARNIFNDRTDAIRRYLEAQLTLLSSSRNEILSCIKGASNTRLYENIEEISADRVVQSFYPRVTATFLRSLAVVFKNQSIVDVAEIIMNDPYAYRAGWPDLTVLKDGNLSFVEVKTTDKLHASQIRFAREVAAPLNLDCSVVRLKAIRT